MAYLQDRKDFEYLYCLVKVDDLSEIEAKVFELMKDPTKAKASEMYQSAIRLWFDQHAWRQIERISQRVASIARRLL